MTIDLDGQDGSHENVGLQIEGKAASAEIDGVSLLFKGVSPGVLASDDNLDICFIPRGSASCIVELIQEGCSLWKVGGSVVKPSCGLYRQKK